LFLHAVGGFGFITLTAELVCPATKPPTAFSTIRGTFARLKANNASTDMNATTMNDTTTKKELSIASIRCANHYKRIFFEGPATSEAAATFETLSEDVGQLPAGSASLEPVLAKARDLYGRAGFVEVCP
jgi:hypothetical protein